MLPNSLPVSSAALRSGERSLPDYLAQLEERFNAREPAGQAYLPEERRFDRLRREAQ
jgi:hypothetical protein